LLFNDAVSTAKVLQREMIQEDYQYTVIILKKAVVACLNIFRNFLERSEKNPENLS
jgi:hypothetical protein